MSYAHWTDPNTGAKVLILRRSHLTSHSFKIFYAVFPLLRNNIVIL